MRPARRIAGAALLLAAVVVAGYVALNWAPDRPVSELTARWAPPPSTFIELLGMQAHVRDEGVRNDPVPVVLLHGTSASLHTWDGWVAALASRRRLIRVDMPGFGLTGPAPSGDYTIGSYVRFVEALLDALGVDRCVLVGNSFGGWVAWETTLADPGRIAGLILVDAAGYPLESQSVPIGFRVAKIPVLNRLVQRILPRSLVRSSVRNVYGDPTRVTPALVDRYEELTLRAGNRAALVQRFVQAPPGLDAERITAVSAPTLILWGGRDRLIPPEHARRFERDIKGSRLVVFEDLGHVPQEEDPARTAAAAAAFLDTLSGSSAPDSNRPPDDDPVADSPG
jgi:pimeloyl-ACP methyl ester carboxylesterase